MVAFDSDRVLVRATSRGWKFAREPLGNCRQRPIFSRRRLGNSAGDSGKPQGDLGDCLRFRTRSAEFLRYHGSSGVSVFALLRAGQNSRPSSAVLGLFSTEWRRQALPDRSAKIKIVCRRENPLTASAVVTIVTNAEKNRPAKVESGGWRKVAAFGLKR